MNDIAYDQFFALDFAKFSIAHDFGCRCGHGFESFNGFFCLTLLNDAENGIENDNKENNENIGKGFRLVGVGNVVVCHCDCRKNRRDKQHDDHRIGELFEKPLDNAVLFGLCQLIGAVFLQPRIGFCCGQTVRGGFQFRKNLILGI